MKHGRSVDERMVVAPILLYPLMENRLGLEYLAWPTRRIQSISSGVIGPLSNASSAAVRSETDLGPVRQRSTAGFVKLNR